ncbi:isopentenyl pyrophosphate isomerase [Nostoc linckia z18]|uniref:Isopentenyl-diphosphate delta-isomerase n=2 Tax=Nostoc linckia TaxID=92942 RepID=A0A9Q5Z9A3_NOSLI|nr:type 2 isopentenyl-diphosphate Delta-isomerase [Nostoc linckia]PHK39973.1 isopentenyl pyrophosphate isomerase [Nostoc linckia z15]PHK43993.1 isopentenyl pyrophosphate isomerase [Nostoc linckia z16]PHJ56880.1 isopentenyl pyrophosphate isomerase [Nostoc linckia z1]PHJ58739.1 isopentenyl pyrophosphate isomerase [Nostoc linckia z3]PHJ62547.1 isopentenyl pyrophosphate isomerase [Nostoc linckia z2]
MTTEIQNRKADHIRLCIEEDVQFCTTTNGFECYRFEHCCLPELDFEEIDLSTNFLGKHLKLPVLISSMTGGTDEAGIINARLATAAQSFGLAMGVGSQRVAIESPSTNSTFSVRKYAPDILLFANFGAVQLNYGYGLTEAQRAVDLLEADALILHFNPLQECIQTGGDRNFKGLISKIENLCRHLCVPVIAKEVGNGISSSVAIQLVEAGVAAIDVAGAGGTSWAKVEAARSNNSRQRHLGQIFAEWGIPTAECIASIRKYLLEVPLIASGGLTNGLEAAKAIALGADLVGLAWAFLQAASVSEEQVFTLAENLRNELLTSAFCTGSSNLIDLKSRPIIKKI